MSWSPTQYSKFEAERSRPVKDLVAQISNKMVAHAADIGCGPGNSTELLQTQFPDATIVGIDNSPEMIEAARKRLPTNCFEVDDISTWRSPGPFDVILSNAALQWVPDHAACFLGSSPSLHRRAVWPCRFQTVSTSHRIAYCVRLPLAE